MTTHKNVLLYGIQITTFVFAAFSAYLRRIAPPPDADPTFSVGLASFLAFIALLFIKAMSAGKSQKTRKAIWLKVASGLFLAAVAAAFLYKKNTDDLTFRFPPGAEERYVAGTRFTPSGQKLHDKYGDNSLLMSKVGLDNIGAVWTDDSRNYAKMLLTANYVALVVCLAGTVFALSEGALGQPLQNRGRVAAQ